MTARWPSKRPSPLVGDAIAQLDVPGAHAPSDRAFCRAPAGHLAMIDPPARDD